jgi:serine/threonine protein kinase
MKSTTSTPFSLGKRVPGTHWEMRGVVGQGAMGIVLEVGKGRNLRAAMKVLTPGFEQRAEFEARFVEEVELLARLRHPNIVEVWDCGVLADGSPFLLMELLRGRTLRALMRDTEMPLTAEAVWKIVGQIVAGLGYAHGDKPPVVHRDVKPENVFLHGRPSVEAKVKLLDFGLAKVLEPTRSAGEPAGTLRYMAPEVLRYGALSPKVDLYALAVLVYELLTRRFPWPVDVRSSAALTEAHLKLEPQAPSIWTSWIPKSVNDGLLRALSKDPDRRQRDVTEFYEDLAALQVVDDGSAKYHTDALTVPTVETLARGRQPSEADSGRSGDRATPTPAPHRGWLELARSRKTPRGESVEPSRETAATSREGPSVPHDAEPGTGRPELGLEEDGEHASGSETDGAARTDMPMTGASVRGMEGRGREGPRRLLLGAAVLVAAGAWGAWAAWHSRAPPVPGVHMAPPAAVALAAAVERDAAVDVPSSGSTGEVAGTEGAAIDAGGPLLTKHEVASGQKARVHTVRLPPAEPTRRRSVKSTQPPPNLDDVLLGVRDAPRPISAPSVANRSERADTPEAAGSVRRAAGWDMRAFGLEEGPLKEPPIATRGAERSVTAGSSDAGALRSAGGTP